MVFDIIAVVFIVIFSLVMMKKGGITAIISLLSVVLSIVSAVFLYPYVTDFAYATQTDEFVAKTVYEALEETGYAARSDIISSMPEFIQKSIAVEENMAVESILTAVSETAADVVVNVMVFLLLVLLSRLVLFIITQLLNGAVELPVLKQCNRLTGFVCGLAISSVAVWIAAAALGVAGIYNGDIAAFTEGSYVMMIMSNFNPF